MTLAQFARASYGFLIGLAISLLIIYFTNSTWAEDYLKLVVIILVSTVPPVLKFILDNHTTEYLKQLGQDKAKLENIDGLTKAVESIKSEFQSQSQMLQSKLDISTGITLNLKAEEHKAVTTLYISFSYWYLQLAYPPHILSSEAMKVEMDETNKTHRQILHDQALFKLYIDDQQLRDSFLACMKYCRESLYPLKSKITRELLPLVQMTELNSKGEHLSSEARKSASKELFQKFDNFMLQFDKANDELTPLAASFTEACRNHLRGAATAKYVESRN
jgi:hypothetical protein